LLIRRRVEPSSIFIFIIFFFLWLPSLYIYYSKLYINLWIQTSFAKYDSAALLFFVLTSISIVFYFLGVIFWKVFIDKNTSSAFAFKKLRLFIPDRASAPFLPVRNKHSNAGLIRILSYISLFFIFVYILNGGFQKIFLLGSDLSKMEFRFAETFADENSGIMALLQIARRVFLPLIIVVYAVFITFDKSSNKLFFRFLILAFFISVLITLDRAPLITFLLVFAYLWFLKAKIDIYFIYKIPILIILVMLFGGTMTFIQHNITAFSLFEVFGTGLEFLWRRIWAAPTIVGIELSTHLFPVDSVKLNLQHSRIMALFGFERVGSQSDASIYVGPVSYIGDVWRNLGFTGVIAVSFLLGILLSFFDYVCRKIQLPYAAGIGIMTITFAFYLTHGVFFSMGVFFQMFFMLFFGVYSLNFYRPK
jgi:hypothetical protein